MAKLVSSFRNMAMSLTVITLVAAAALAGIYLLTQARIEQQKRDAELSAQQSVLAGDENGTAIKVAVDGFGGKMISIRIDREILFCFHGFFQALHMVFPKKQYSLLKTDGFIISDLLRRNNKEAAQSDRMDGSFCYRPVWHSHWNPDGHRRGTPAEADGVQGRGGAFRHGASQL